MSAPRILLGLALLAMVGLLGYHVLAASTPAPGDREALTPRERLQQAPLDGDAFADLAVALRDKGDAEATYAMHRIASRRDPRDLRIHTWLAEQLLRTGDYAAALEHLDVVLRLETDTQQTLLPLMAQWADDPAFAEALAARLRGGADWRGGMMGALRAGIQRPGAGAVFAALRESGHIEEAELSYWLDALMAAGEWGLAYSYWASSLDLASGEALPMLYNGDFERPPSQQGFDWRTGLRPGSYTEFEPAAGARGQAAHMVFSGRPVDLADLEQALALQPGRYRLSMRLRAVSLRSDQGLRWTLTCEGQPNPLAIGAPIEGTFDWRTASMDFLVPKTGCPGQRLRLDNPAPPGSASSVSGDLWVDDLRLRTGPLSAVDRN